MESSRRESIPQPLSGALIFNGSILSSFKAMSILRKLETMKEYNDEVASIENAAKPSHPRSALVAAIQQENRQIKVSRLCLSCAEWEVCFERNGWSNCISDIVLAFLQAVRPQNTMFAAK